MSTGTNTKLAAGTGGSVVVDSCQVCGHAELDSVLFLGYLPPVNQMRPIGQRPHEQPAYPAELLYCPQCELVQIGLVVDPEILFPPDYPYTSGTTRILHENFANLAEESAALLGLGADDLVVDIGSNDGTLLSKFQGRHRVLGIEPTDAGRLAVDKGIETITAYFSPQVGARVRASHGPARVVTAANCFAHIENVHAIVEGVIAMLGDDGVFINESHYLIPLLDTVQYDTVYHEHLRYYSLTSVRNLLEGHGLEVIHACPIPSHGGSIRVYAARRGTRPVQPSVAAILAAEAARGPMREQLRTFRDRTILSKLRLHGLLADIKARGERVIAVSAPSRASTLANYVGLDDGLIDYVVEIKGSRKIGRNLPGTLVPVVEESRMFDDQPDYALLFSWHIAGELMPKLRAKGFKGRFIVPLPDPVVVD
ncbi:class I SAM-dependent methyltransferase [Magnetospirillum sp. SS-4]|uniref:class I SAM-dependent methyltransferase n=1 Tax=Magnetospirillum sp. SS-4 TaxID=2681465 RepID=UPI00138539B9|nr:class I SAM-dependent methyltransferase [Magnetospirillum sp. SS-4]CAA7620033.1 Methyltransferase family protein [Magnetospirillum sp. SS-4]